MNYFDIIPSSYVADNEQQNTSTELNNGFQPFPFRFDLNLVTSNSTNLFAPSNDEDFHLFRNTVVQYENDCSETSSCSSGAESEKWDSSGACLKKKEENKFSDKLVTFRNVHLKRLDQIEKEYSLKFAKNMDILEQILHKITETGSIIIEESNILLRQVGTTSQEEESSGSDQPPQDSQSDEEDAEDSDEGEQSKKTKKEMQSNRLFNEDVVHVLRQWFLDHIDDPYPNSKEKADLAKKTGLTLKKVSNWFINTRMRHLPKNQPNIAKSSKRKKKKAKNKRRSNRYESD